MAEKPIIFSTPMVQAILAERKSQTRRVIKQQPNRNAVYRYIVGDRALFESDAEDAMWHIKLRYQPGDILWVRERWGTAYTYGGKGDYGKVGMYVYLADDDTLTPTISMKWYPSIYMPREASRIFLRVGAVRVERLQTIAEDDAIAEGIGPRPDIGLTAVDEYAIQWDDLNAKRGYGWDVNPWVWVYEFERIEKEVDHAD